MVWLDGLPTHTKPLSWPPNDPDLQCKTRRHQRQGWSVLDHQILFFRAFAWVSPDNPNPRTVVYIADAQSEIVFLERVVQLEYAAHRVAIVPGVGFVTAEWVNSGVWFRAHTATGELLRKRHCPALASYGELNVFGRTVSLCVSSTDAPSVPSDVHFRRLDYEPGYTRHFPVDLAADSIATFDAGTGDLWMVGIPQAPLKHSAELQYITPDRIVLGSSLAFGNGAVVYAFSTNGEEESRKFYHGQHTDLHMIAHHLGKSSTSGTSPIVVSGHDNEGRITVFKRELLVGDIPSSPTSKDPPGMREVFNYPNDARTLRFHLAGLTSVASTRVLVNGTEDRTGQTAVFVLDFDQRVLGEVVARGLEEREEWNREVEDRKGRVRVVTRRFFCGVGGEVVDAEYPWPPGAPPEWEAHLEGIRKEGEEDEEGYMDDSDDDDDGEVGPVGVEYDEAPEEHREPVPFGYIQTTLRLEGVEDVGRLAITEYGVVELPEPGGEGRVFYF